MPLTLTLDDLRSHIVRFVSSTSIHITIGYMAPLSLIVTDGRMDRHFSHMLTGHLLQSKDDLIITPASSTLKLSYFITHLTDFFKQ